MSQITKARERLLSKNKEKYIVEVEEPQDEKNKKLPRKFTLSSLSHNLDVKNLASMGSQSRQEYFSPKHSHLMRINTQAINFNANHQFYNPARSSRNFEKQSRTTKRNVVHLFQENNAPSVSYSPIQLHHDQESFDKSQAKFIESPTKNLNKKPFHTERINIIIAPPQKRVQNSPFKPKECIKQLALEFIQQNIGKKQCFTDQSFPPARTIIFTKKILYQEAGLKFQRITRLFQREIELLKSSEPTLIELGNYTNPYLYSALTIIAEEPSRIISIFGDQTANDEGIYYVNLCKDGVWRYIIVDDCVPIKQTSKRDLLFMYSRQKDNIMQIWPTLIQKAIAKIYGTYTDLSLSLEEGITPLFKILTGLPVSSYLINKDFRSYLIVIDAALKKKHIVILEGISQNNRETAFLKNMHINHSYKVVDIKKSGILLRNMSDNELCTKLSFQEAMIFSKLLIFRNEPSYIYTTQKLRHKISYYSTALLKVATTSRCYFQVWQNNPAYYKKHLGSNIEYEISPSVIHIVENNEIQESEPLVCQNGKQTQLKAGQYLVKVHLCQKKESDFTLSCYSEHEIEIQRIKNMEQWNEPCLCKIK